MFPSIGHATSLPEEIHRKPPPETLETPLRFKSHNFQAFYYNVADCHIIYDKFDYGDPLAGQGILASAPPSGDYRKQWDGTHVGIRNFPAPIEIDWKSLDGSGHHASVDLKKIFQGELIWHALKKQDMADFYKGPVAGAPDIFLEVNDRRVSVFMTMPIPTRAQQIPGKKYSNVRRDLFLVWSRSY